ncbi:hypothetical protein GCM10015535_21060 [Streptomyces gelaticus]|uniref:Secreted protein n=1 Tax=Streptomyces gelaticus TaxID=285446 RepID=A0ABQ2VWG6_9ACTN|nr:hypothetical protein [Streptomyces gelaticus]GGV81335.1 hypothetical protein GCM10015535_21060 [Streptomyces gelaticus]
MFHRIRTHQPRTLVHLVLLPLARVLRALTPVPASVSAPRVGTRPQPQPPYAPRPLHAVLRTRSYALDDERRFRRTAMRLALDGIVVLPGVSQAHSVGSPALTTTKAAA